MFPWN